MASQQYIRALESADAVQARLLAGGEGHAGMAEALAALLRLTGSTAGCVAALGGQGAARYLHLLQALAAGPDVPAALLPVPAAPLAFPADGPWLLDVLARQEPAGLHRSDLPPALAAVLARAGGSAHGWAMPLPLGAPPTGLLLLVGRPGGYKRIEVEALAPLARCLTHLVGRHGPAALTPAATAPDITAPDETELAAPVPDRALLHALPLGVLVVQGGAIVHANPVARALLGSAARLMEDWLAPDDGPAMDAMMRACEAAVPPPAPLDLAARAPDGTERWLRCHALPLEWGGAPATGLLLLDLSDQQDAQRELQGQRRQMRAILEAFPDYAYIKDRDLRYVQVSRALADMFDVEPAAMLGKRLVEMGLLHAEQVETLEALDRRVFTEGQSLAVEEILLPRMDGSERIQSLKRFPILDEHGRVDGVVGITSDISARVLAQRRSESQERLLRSVFDAMPHRIVVKDRDGTYLIVNTAFATDAEETTDSLEGRRITDLRGYDDEFRRRIGAAMERTVRTGERSVIAGNWRTTLGGKLVCEDIVQVPMVDGQGAVSGLVSVSIDITESKQAEEEIRAGQRLLRTVLDTIPDAIHVKDAQGRISMLNKAFADVAGRPMEQIIGRRMEELGHLDPETLARLKYTDERAIRTGKLVEVMEMAIPQASGERKMRRIQKAPLPGPDGKAVGVVGISIDITPQVEAERRLLDQQALLNSVLDTIPFAILVQDREGRLQIVNETFCRRTGRAREQLLGARFVDLDHVSRKDRESLAEMDEEVLRTGTPQERPNAAIMYADGSQAFRHMFKDPLLDRFGHITGIVTIAMDVTDRVLADRRLRDSERLLHAVIETIPHLIAVKDRDGILVLVNSAYHDLLGIEARQMLGRHTTEIEAFDAAAVAGFIEEDRQLMAGEVSALHIVQRMPATDGRTIHLDTHKRALLDENGRPDGIVAIGTDITERVAAETREGLAAARLRDAIESLPAAFMLFDANERLLMWNSRLTQYFPEFQGVTRAGMPYAEIAAISSPHIRNTDADLPYVDDRLREFRAGSHPGVRQRTDGRWVQFVDQRTSDGGTVSLRFDITELKTRELELAQAQKMEAVGQLTGGVAHDFNNLLTVILGNVELLRRQSETTDKGMELLERVAAAGERGAALTQRLLAFSRRQTLQPRPTDLNALIVGLRELLQRAIGETIQLTTELAPEPWMTRIDPMQLENALLNLIINARDAMPDGGHLTIQTRNTNVDESFGAANDVLPGYYVRLTVADTGQGIDPNDLERVFDPFFTTKEVGKGSGLGLSMVYGFVHQSAGHVRIESKVGGGTQVHLYLPRVAAGSTAAVTAETPEARAIPRGSGQRVLIVEDDVHIARLAKELLTDLGYVTVGVGEAALALGLLHRDPQVQVLFTDVVLPGGISGLDLAKAARGVRPDLKILFTTGYTEHERMSRSLIDEQALLLKKPYQIAELAERLHQLLQ